MAGEPFVFLEGRGELQARKAQGYARKEGQTGQAVMHRTLKRTPMKYRRMPLSACCAVFLIGMSADTLYPSTSSLFSGNEQSGTTTQSTDKPAQEGVPALPRGKKLVLRDGSFQLVRNYERKGDRVRYYSAERGAWEEIPAALVDWEATAKAEETEKSEEDALAKKIHAQEQAQRIETVMDVDASLQVAPGVFLPPGEGMFLIEGKSVTLLEQAGSQVKTDKKQFLKQVLSPIPIIPSKRNVEIPGSRAKVRVTSAQVEFYLREAPPDPDRTTPIEKSSRPGESGPEVELVRATVKGNKRQLESIKSLFGEQMEEKRATISVERWEIAPTVYRFTLSQPLPPGEYALAEILTGGMNLYVWDFGVDPPGSAKPAPQPTKK
jgi:hypothetical protein